MHVIHLLLIMLFWLALFSGALTRYFGFRAKHAPQPPRTYMQAVHGDVFHRSVRGIYGMYVERLRLTNALEHQNGSK